MVQDLTLLLTNHFVVHVLQGNSLLPIKKPMEHTSYQTKLLVLFVKSVGTAIKRISFAAKLARQEDTMTKLTRSRVKHVLLDRIRLLIKQIVWCAKKERTMIKRINCFVKVVDPDFSTIKRDRMKIQLASFA